MCPAIFPGATGSPNLYQCGKCSVNPYRLLAKCGGEVLAKRIKPDVLGWNKALVAGGFLAAPGGAANVDPIGGLIASALVALIFHKGFQQNWLKAVSAKPVIGQLAGG